MSARNRSGYYSEGTHMRRRAPTPVVSGIFSEKRAQLDDALFLLLEHAVERAQQPRLRGTRDRLAHADRSDQAIRHGAPRARLGGLVGPFGGFVALLFCCALHEAQLTIFGPQSLELLRSHDDAAGIDLVVLEELSELGGH